MFRKVFALVAFFGLMTACSPDDANNDFDIGNATIVKVSGDLQESVVATQSYDAVEVPNGGSLALASFQLVPDYDFFPEVLKVKLDLGGDGGGFGILTAPNFQNVPSGTLLHWEVVEEGCGRPFGTPTAVDDTAFSVNRWVKGTKAGLCHMRVCRILPEGDITCDQVFEAVQLPGPAKFVEVPDQLNPGPFNEGDTIHLDSLPWSMRDMHDNVIPAEEFQDRVGVPEWELVVPMYSTNVPGESYAEFTLTSGTGWDVEVPAWRHQHNGLYYIRFAVEDATAFFAFYVHKPVE